MRRDRNLKTKYRNRRGGHKPISPVRQNSDFMYYRSNPSNRGDVERRNTKLEGGERLANGRKRRNLYILIVALTIVLLWLPLSTTPEIVIQNQRKGLPSTDVARYKLASEHILSESLTSHTKLTLNKTGFEQQLKKQFPEIGDVKVSYSLFSYHPTVSLALEPPAMVLSSKAGQYLISGNGIIIAPLEKSTESDLPLVHDNALQQATPGKAVLPASYVRFVNDVLAQLKANNLQVGALSMPPGLAELDLAITGDNYAGQFNMEGNSREQAGTFLAARNYLEKNHKLPKQYINVMVPGKAYYK